MSYMRNPYYVFGDGKNINFYHNGNHFLIPNKIMEELVVMMYAEMNKKQRLKAELRAMEKFSGNFGCDPLLKKYKRKTSLDYIKAFVKTRKNLEAEEKARKK